MNIIFFLIGSSGSGKTTVAESIEAMKIAGLVVLRSDSVKVPTSEEMIKEHGSMSEWQRVNTIKWVKEIKEKYLESTKVLFDTQSRPTFIKEACENNHVQNYEIILIDCSDEERKRRLIEGRQSPELASDRMMDWARYLRENCIGDNCQIIDNTNFTPTESTDKVLEIINFSLVK